MIPALPASHRIPYFIHHCPRSEVLEVEKPEAEIQVHVIYYRSVLRGKGLREAGWPGKGG